MLLFKVHLSSAPQELGVAEALLGVVLVGCVLRRWPSLLDPQPPSVPQLSNPLSDDDDEEDVTPDPSPVLHLMDVFCSVDSYSSCRLKRNIVDTSHGEFCGTLAVFSPRFILNVTARPLLH